MLWMRDDARARPKETTRGELEIRRVRLRVSREAMARETGISPWTIFRIEKNTARARVGDVARLEEVLDRLERAVCGAETFGDELLGAIRRNAP